MLTPKRPWSRCLPRVHWDQPGRCSGPDHILLASSSNLNFTTKLPRLPKITEYSRAFALLGHLDRVFVREGEARYF